MFPEIARDPFCHVLHIRGPPVEPRCFLPARKRPPLGSTGPGTKWVTQKRGEYNMVRILLDITIISIIIISSSIVIIMATISSVIVIIM